jgi:vitamin B12 transporter
VTATLDYSMGNRGDGKLSDLDVSFRNDFENLYATAALQYKLTDNIDLSLSGRISRRNTWNFEKQVFEGIASTTADILNDSNDGGSVRVTWAEGMHSVVFGADYDHGTLKSETIETGKQTLEKWAVYVNDTITYKACSATPGLRYDHTSTNGDFWSPSLGLTCKVHETTILRGYVARGFSIPPLSATFGASDVAEVVRLSNPDLEVEKVNAYQVGAESTAIPYVWVKGTLFLYDVYDAIENKVVEEPVTNGLTRIVTKAVNTTGKTRRQGVEVELRTVPVYNTSLYAGFAFVDAENRDTGDRIPGVGRYTYDIGLLYDDRRTFKALLIGHYVWWDTPSEFQSKYNAFVWDVSLMKKFDLSQKVKGEIFFTAHNIFNGSQYAFGDARNPRRWIEGGVRVRF